MKEFPKYLLALAFFNCLPVLLSVFFLFGGVHPFGLTANKWINMLFYLLTNLLWIVPIATFFVGLNESRRGYDLRATLILLIGVAFTIYDIVLLIWFS